MPDFFRRIDGIEGLIIGILINGDESLEYFQSNELKQLNELSELVYKLAPIAKKVQVLDCRSLDGPCKQWPDITEDFFPVSPKQRSWSEFLLSWFSGSNTPGTKEEKAAQRSSSSSYCH